MLTADCLPCQGRKDLKPLDRPAFVHLKLRKVQLNARDDRLESLKRQHQFRHGKVGDAYPLTTSLSEVLLMPLSQAPSGNARLMPSKRRTGAL